MSERGTASRRWFARALTAAAVVLALTGTTVADAARAALAPCPTSRYRSARTLIIAHASGDWFGPPNTIEMLRASKAAGADVLDTDVRVTKDGQLVASHDDVVKVGRVQRSISRSTLAELRTLDLGDEWAGPRKNFPLRGKAVRVPTVPEVLAAFPKALISMEFKATGGERALCSLLRSTKRTGDVYIGSAGDAAVDVFAPLCPEVTTTVTDAMVPTMRAARQSGAAWCSPSPIGQPPLSRGSTFRLTKASVEWNHAHGLAMFTWTADTEASLRFVATLGVDGVYTARADLAKRILNRS